MTANSCLRTAGDSSWYRRLHAMGSYRVVSGTRAGTLPNIKAVVVGGDKLKNLRMGLAVERGRGNPGGQRNPLEHNLKQFESRRQRASGLRQRSPDWHSVVHGQLPTTKTRGMSVVQIKEDIESRKQKEINKKRKQVSKEKHTILLPACFFLS